jgi:hypothetical protein
MTHTPALCDVPVAFDNRGNPVRRCGHPLILSLGERCVLESCAANHWHPRAVVPEKAEWYQ